MKNNIKRLLSTLLVLTMIIGAVAVMFTTTAVAVYADDASDSEGETEEIKGFDSAKFLKTSYANAEDKLRTMSIVTDTGMLDQYLDPIYVYAPYKTYNQMTLYVQPETGEVAVKNMETGQVLFTNPYDAAPKQIDENGEAITDQRLNATSKLPEMFSQLILSYETIKDGKVSSMNTFTEAAMNNQIVVTQIKNGVAVEYTMGTVEERRLVPMYMEKYRFEHLILANIRENNAAAYNKMLSYYANKMFMNEEDGSTLRPEVRASYELKYPALASYGPEDDRKLFVSDDYDETMIPEYDRLKEEDRAYYETLTDREKLFHIPYFEIPYSGYLSMYVYGLPSSREMVEIEGWIKQYDPTYTFEDLEYDHKLTGYVATTTVIPSFKMALEYTLTDDGFQVRLPANSIIFDEDNFRLQSVSILPYMGAGSDDNKGYVFVPDGSGSLIRFEDYVGTSVIFSTGTMYGPDNAYHTLPTSYTGHEEIMRIPVYGVSETVEKNYTKNDEGGYTEDCTHRWVKKSITADCVRKINGGEVVYCAYCGLSYSETKPYTHTFSSVKTIQSSDCHHIGIVEAECSVCKDFYQKLINNLYTPEQIEAQYGDLLKYTIIDDDYGAHNYNDVRYVEVDGECYEYYLCSNKYELRDDNGNIVYQTDENGELILDSSKNPMPVMVQCGEMKKGEDGVAANGLVKVEHEFDDDHAITYTKDGHCYIEHSCMNCGYSVTSVDEHRFDGEGVLESRDGSCYVKNNCTICGLEVHTPVAHTYSDEVVYEAGDGLCVEKHSCILCGYEDVYYLAHTAGSTSEAIYDTVGHRCYVKHTCETCGAVYTEDIAHELDDSGKCVKCGYALPEEDGKVYKESYIQGEDGACYRAFICEELDGKEYKDGALRLKVDHVYTTMQTEGAACLPEIRSYYVCAHCGKIAGERIEVNEAMAEHNLKFVRTAGDNCIDGYDEDEVCTVCGQIFDHRHIVGHIYGEKTELLTGLFETTCTVCGHTHYISEKVEEETGSEEPAVPVQQNEEKETADDDTHISIETKRGYMAIMTEGAALASLTAVTGGAESRYCRAYMTVTPRPKDTYNLRDAISSGSDAEWTVVSKRKYTGNYTFDVTMLQTADEELCKKVGISSTKYDASYSGMADVYRTHLLKNGVLKELDRSEAGIPLYLEMFGTINVSSSFMTIPITEKKALNTFESIKGVVDDLKAEGIDSSSINIKLEGFTNGGMTATMPYKVKFESAVGGDEGYSDFLAYADEKNIGVYPNFDFAYMHANGWFDGYTDSDHAVKTIDGRYIVKKKYNSTLQIFMSTGMLAVSASVYDYFYQTFAENYGKFENRGIAATTLGNDLNSDFDTDDPYNREDAREFTADLLEKLNNSFGSVMIDGGNDYTLAYADHILNMSLTGSTYLRTSCSVPFMAMVLHGYKNYAGTATNMASSIDQEMLHIIENGASPYFIIATDNTKYLKESSSLSKYYSLDYSTWKNDLIDIYKELNEVLKDIQNAKFIGHTYVSGIRVPDADENETDMDEVIETIHAAIKAYKTAELRNDKAAGLYARKFTDKLAELKDAAKKIIEKYEWANENAELESTDLVLSTEDRKALDELLDEIKYLEAVMSVTVRKTVMTTDEELHVALYNDIESASEEFKAVQAAFELIMSQNEIFFDVAEEDRLNPEAYNQKSFKGAFYIKDDKIVVTTDGAVDVNGDPIKSTYAMNDNSIACVTYDNGISIYLNYNYFDVIVKIDGENVRIGAYQYYKKGAN